MCNINIIKRKDEYPDEKINTCMDVISIYSFASNDDGEGYIGITSNHTRTDRSLNKIQYNKLTPFHTLITHQRLTTSGPGINNTHPHEGKNFILQHNGIFHGIGNNDKSDTKIYLETLEQEYKKTLNVIDAIKEVHKKVTGSYSIILYDKNTEKIYYYKNSTTSMYKVEDKKYIAMSTDKKNLKVAKMILGINTGIKEVKDYNIYELTNHGLKFITKIPPREYTTTINEYTSDDINTLLGNDTLEYAQEDADKTIKEYKELQELHEKSLERPLSDKEYDRYTDLWRQYQPDLY